MFEKTDKKLEKLNKHRPLGSATQKSLAEDMYLRFTYHSNAIEGSTLTMRETKVVLEGITIGGKTINEHLEALNHNEAIIYLESLVQKKERLTEFDIKSIHSLILKKIDDKNAGTYRNGSVVIAGATHTPPPHYLINEKMEHMMELYNNEWQELHPIRRAALLHAYFVGIHPFSDGNGRTSRLIMNFELMKAGYTFAIVEKDDRLKYYDALDKYHTTSDIEDFVEIVENCTEQGLDRILKLVDK